jgi:hypothetical protein
VVLPLVVILAFVLEVAKLVVAVLVAIWLAQRFGWLGPKH